MFDFIPAEANETLVFTPPQLEAKMERPPRFRLRAVQIREKRFFDRLMIEEGVRQHSTDTFRAEILRGLSATATPESAAELEPRLKAFWEALDDHDKEQATLPAEERKPFEHPDKEAVEAFGEKMADAWPPLRQITADNADAATMLPLISVAVAVTGWDNLDALYEKDRGFVTINSANSILEALRKLDEEHGVSPGLSWVQLAGKAVSRIFLPKEQEKNSASPSPSSSPPSNTKTDGQVSPAGTSPASATSTETPAS
jgi:hypothetical protein